MLFIQDIEKEIDNIKNVKEDLKRINETLSKGEFLYAYPYQLKLFIIKYAKLVKEAMTES
jgi:hypothetical protein